jgi:hypothetical protein
MNVGAASSALASSSVQPDMQPHIVFEVFFDSAGAKTRTRVLETGFGERTTRAVQSTIYDTVAESFSAEPRDWGVLVKATKEEISPFLIDRMEYCPCTLINRDEIVHAVTRIARQKIPGISGKRSLVLDVRSDSTGAVLEKKLSQSTGSLELDRILFELTAQMRIAPALLNRRPTNGWSRLPITVMFSD